MVIVVHRILSSMLGAAKVEAIEFAKGFLSLFLVSFGGFFIGIIFGVFTSLLTLKTTHVRGITRIYFFQLEFNLQTSPHNSIYL